MAKVSRGLTIIWFNPNCLEAVKVYIGPKLEAPINLESKNGILITYKKNLLIGYYRYRGVLVTELVSPRVLDYTNILLTLS